MVVATKIDLSLQSSVFMADGVMAMGIKRSSINADTYFTEALANRSDGLITSKNKAAVFGMVLSNNGTGPKFIFGGTDKNELKNPSFELFICQVVNDAVRILRGFRGSLHSFNTDTIQIFWETELFHVKVNGNNISITNIEAVIDSCSSFIGGSPGDIANLYSNIPGSAPDPTNPGQFTSTPVAVLLLE